MKIAGIPFLMVFLLALTPMAGSFLDVPTYHVPPMLAVWALIFATTLTHDGFSNAFHERLTWVVLIMLALLIIQVAMGRGFVILSAGGAVLIFALVFHSLFSSGHGISANTIVSGIGLLYKFFIVGMMIELAAIILGAQPLLGGLFSSENTPGYKMYNPADLPRLFGAFKDVGGINSILLGSQIAGMLSLFAAIWFVGIRQGKSQGAATDLSGFWVFSSCCLLLISINGTVLLLAILAAIIYRFYIRPKRVILSLTVMSLIFAGLYFLVAQGFLLARIFSDEVALYGAGADFLSKQGLSPVADKFTVLDYYYYSFLNPVYFWLSLDGLNKLIGVGAQFFLNDEVFIAGDFGFATDVLLKAGGVWAVVFVFTVFAICFSALRWRTNGSDEQRLWSGIGSISALIALLLLFSTVHYNQALGNPGGIALFALHLALAMYCRSRLRILARIPQAMPRERAEEA
jgi:hypothetical protein